MAIEKGLITVAIQKSGRLNEDTVKLLKECDIDVPQGGRQDVGYSRKFPLKFLYVRNSDIPSIVSGGYADLGVTGEDVVLETGEPLIEAMKLPYGGCNLALGVRSDFPYRQLSDLRGMQVATSFPRLTENFFRFNGVKDVGILELGGSVELAANQNWVKACVDITSSGESMRVNGLEVRETLLSSQAEIVVSKKLRQRPETEEDVMDLFGRIAAVTRARQNRFIAVNVPLSEVPNITRIAREAGSTSPNINRSMDDDVVEVQALIGAKNFWVTTRRMLAAGGRELAELSVIRSLPNPDDPQMADIRQRIYGQSIISGVTIR